MSHDPHDLERQHQAAAERPPSATEDAAVRRHRYVLHAIARLPVPLPPADFARQVEARLADYPEQAGAEQGLLAVAALAAGVLGAVTLAPWLADSVAGIAAALGAVPWRLMIAMAAGLAGFALIDALRQRRGSA